MLIVPTLPTFMSLRPFWSIFVGNFKRPSHDQANHQENNDIFSLLNVCKTLQLQE